MASCADPSSNDWMQGRENGETVILLSISATGRTLRSCNPGSYFLFQEKLLKFIALFSPPTSCSSTIRGFETLVFSCPGVCRSGKEEEAGVQSCRQTSLDFGGESLALVMDASRRPGARVFCLPVSLIRTSLFSCPWLQLQDEGRRRRG